MSPNPVAMWRIRRELVCPTGPRIYVLLGKTLILILNDTDTDDDDGYQWLLYNGYIMVINGY